MLIYWVLKCSDKIGGEEEWGCVFKPGGLLWGEMPGGRGETDVEVVVVVVVVVVEVEEEEEGGSGLSLS